MRIIELTQSDMDDSKKALIVLSNSIAEARYNLSMPTQKLLLYLISKITYEERKQGIFLNTLEFSLTEIKALLSEIGRANSKTEKEVIRRAVDELHKNYIKKKIITKSGKEIFETWSWSQYSKFDEEKNIFTFKFNQDVAPLLLELKNYFKSNLVEYLKLSSKHSIKLYTLFRSSEFMKNRVVFTLDELKSHLEVSNKYERWDGFKNIVLTPSFEELNKETNYFFEYETERVGRSIGKIIIYTYEKENDLACTRFVRKTIDSFLKKNKIESSTRNIFQNLKFSFEKEEETLFISFKDKLCLDEFLTQTKSKTEKEAYAIIDKGLASYGIDKLLRSLFRNQTDYKYSNIDYKRKVTKKHPPKKEPNKAEEETYLDMHELEKMKKEISDKEILFTNEEVLKIKKFGLTQNQAHTVREFENVDSVKERVKSLIEKGVELLDIPSELIKEYQELGVL